MTTTHGTHAFVVILCLAAPAGSSSRAYAQERETHDLEALTRAAEETWPSLRGADHAIEAAEARLDEATVSPFFQLTATAAFTAAPEQRGTPLLSDDEQLPLSNAWRPVFRVGVEGAIPVYTFGKLRNARRAARAGVRAAELERESALARLRFDVRRAYYALQLALDVQQMIGEGESKLRRAVERIQERVDNNDPDADPMDLYRLASALAEVEARGSEAVRFERTSRQALQILTGLQEVQIPDCPLGRIPYELQELDEYIRGAGETRPEAGMLAQLLQAREADLAVNRARFFPDFAIALEASYSVSPGITNQTNPFIQDRGNYQTLGAALVARWQLDFWGNVHRVRRAEAQLFQAEAQRDEATRGMAIEIAAAYEEVADAGRREEAWGRAHRETRRWFVAAAQAYQVGTLEPKDLVDAVKAYFTARYSHLESMRDHNTALARLSRVTGDPLRPADGWEVSCEE